jgi:DNA-binding response OmpR family regulator
MLKIFIIEDDETLAQAIVASLRQHGYEADYVTGGHTGKTRILNQPETYDILVLDWLLPDDSGVEICRELRQQQITAPILILTGKDRTEDKVLALSTGADDYLTKPFSMPELTARLQALSRRPRRPLDRFLRLGELSLDTETKKVHYGSQEIILTLKEFAILEYLMRHPGEALTREQILDHVWDYEVDSFSNIVDVHINNLRKKIAPPGAAEILTTIRGVGYSVRANA